jgi:hypothetical protein
VLARDGELFLGYGLVLMAIAAALCHFVMVGLIGLAIFPAAVALLMAAGLKARAPDMDARSLWFGMALLLAGIAAIVVGSTFASTLFFRLLRTFHVPAIEDWLSLGVVAFASPLLLVSALRFLTDWPGNRCLYWGIGVLGVVPATVLLFLIFSVFLPLSA